MSTEQFNDLSHYKWSKWKMKDAMYEVLSQFTINQSHTNRLGATLRRTLLDTNADLQIENVREILEIIEWKGQAIVEILASNTCIKDEADPKWQAQHTLDQVESILLGILEKETDTLNTLDEKSDEGTEEKIDKTKHQEFYRIGAGSIHISPVTGGFAIQEFESRFVENGEEPLHEYICHNYTVDSDGKNRYISVYDFAESVDADFAYQIEFEEL